MNGFLAAFKILAPIIVQTLTATVPGLHPAAAPFILNAVQAAEAIPGASGSDKLTAAVAIAQSSLQVAAQYKVPFDANAIATAVPGAVQTTVDIINAVKPAHPALVVPAPIAAPPPTGGLT